MSQFKSYPAYKDSGVEWLGQIPENWPESVLKRAFQIEGGSTPPPDEANWEGDITWVTPADLSGLKSLFIGESKRKITATGLASCGASILPKGSLVLSTRAPIGSLAIATIKMCTNQGCKGLIPNESTSSHYFAYVLSVAKEELNNRGRGTTFLEISGDELGRFNVPMPSFAEQAQIARFLDHETARIDGLIEEQKRLIELLKEKRQAVISHTVTKGLDPTVPMKDSGVEWLGEVPAHWKISPLKYHCTFSGGGTPSKENLDYWNGDIPWVSPKDMKRFWINDSQDKITMLGVSESSTSLVSSGAVLMVVRSGILQRTIPLGINSVEVSINQDMKALRFSVEELARYFTYLVIGFEPSWLLAWRKQGATVESLEQEYLSDSLIPIPSKNEANAIVEKLNWLSGQYDDLERESRESIRLLQERRSALISAAVTGKIDVRDWQPPTDNSAPSAAVQKNCLETV